MPPAHYIDYYGVHIAYAVTVTLVQVSHFAAPDTVHLFAPDG